MSTSGEEVPKPTTPPSADPPPRADDGVRADLRRISRRGFAWGATAAVCTAAGLRWLVTRKPEDGLPWPFRRVLALNEQIARAAFRSSSAAPEFSQAAAKMPRANGDEGMRWRLDLAAWQLHVSGAAGERTYTLDELKALPRVEMTTELKCIEGWSTVVHWAGVRLADLAAHSGFASRTGRRDGPDDLFSYTGLETPSGGYYVGLDTASALHPQTLLCYEMGGQPLTWNHGAPLRLVIPVKYGIKYIKQIGKIQFTDVRPRDFWAEQGYDWYAGH